MVDHTSTRWHDLALAFPGHNSWIVRVNETRVHGLHCEDCHWFGGSFKEGQWCETRMAKAWAGHQRFIEAGGVIEHGHRMCAPAGICRCRYCRRAPFTNTQAGPAWTPGAGSHRLAATVEELITVIDRELDQDPFPNEKDLADDRQLLVTWSIAVQTVRTAGLRARTVLAEVTGTKATQ